MGILRLRKSDIARAKDVRAFEKVMDLIGDSKSPKKIITLCRGEFDRMGVRLVNKPALGLRSSKWSLTLPNQLRLGVDFDKKPLPWQAAGLCHELGHAFDWEILGIVKFGANFAFARRRWALEMHCHRISVALVDRLMPAQVLRYINTRPARMLKVYRLGAIRGRDLKKHTIAILKSAI